VTSGGFQVLIVVAKTRSSMVPAPAKRNGPKVMTGCTLHSLRAAMASDVPSCSLRKYSEYRTIP
jgi:hypothetical protein